MFSFTEMDIIYGLLKKTKQAVIFHCSFFHIFADFKLNVMTLDDLAPATLSVAGLSKEKVDPRSQFILLFILI